MSPRLLLPLVALALGACSLLPQPTPPVAAAGEVVRALTPDHRLLGVAAAAPQTVISQCQISGLKPAEALLGIDYRVARGQLYALGRSGQLYTIDGSTCHASPVGPGIGWPLLGARVGIDFNPVVDRLRVVTEAGQNLRVHPDTGRVVDGAADTLLGYVNTDRHAGQALRVVAAGYTYNPDNDKITTNYAIDLARSQLVMMGSHESKVPPVSPNTGRVMSVGPLGVDGLVEADLDISDVKNQPLAMLRTDQSRLYRIDLATGRATLIGPIGDGSPVRSIAIEP
jgi:Domain of unknown function (DUF4394)